MKILITGHDGYIGAVLLPFLQGAGYDPVGLDAGWFGDCLFGEGDGAPPVVERRDFRDVEPADLAGFDAIVHLAALSNDPLGDLDPTLTGSINRDATLRLAASAAEAGVERFVFSSSCSSYGAAGDDLLDERAQLRPVTPYGRSKVAVEAELVRLAGPRFTPVLLRNATAYGASPRLRLDLVLNNLVGCAHTTGKIVLQSDGTPWRPLVHVEDICRAIRAALEAPAESVRGEAFNIGRTAENYRIGELAEIVADTVPGCTIEHAPGAGPDRRCYRVSCRKAEELLPGFEPRWDARRGAAELAAAYRREGLTREIFEGPRYKRLAHIRGLIDAGCLSSELRWV